MSDRNPRDTLGIPFTGLEAGSGESARIQAHRQSCFRERLAGQYTALDCLCRIRDVDRTLAGRISRQPQFLEQVAKVLAGEERVHGVVAQKTFAVERLAGQVDGQLLVAGTGIRSIIEKPSARAARTVGRGFRPRPVRGACQCSAYRPSFFSSRSARSHALRGNEGMPLSPTGAFPAPDFSSIR